MASPAPPPKFKLFSRSRPGSPAPSVKKKEPPPPVLTVGPSTLKDRWEPGSDGDALEFHSHEASIGGSSSGQNTPFSSRVRTAPATLINQPSPPYPPHPHTAQFLAPSTNLQRPKGLQHPFSANYEPRSQEYDLDYAAMGLHRARDTNRKRLAPIPRSANNDRIHPQMHAISPGAQRRPYSPAPEASINRGSPEGVPKDAPDEGEEVDLDIYPWFIFQQQVNGEPEAVVDKKGTTEFQDYSFMSMSL